MAGCTHGIETAKVKAPNGRPSLLFQNLISHYEGDLDKSYYSYLKSYTVGFEHLRQASNFDGNGELLASVVLGELTKNDLGLSKDLTGIEPTNQNKDDAKSPGTPSLMVEILKSSRLILDPEVDSEGNQADSYGITNTEGGAAIGFLGRVSNLIGQFSLRPSDLKDKSGKVYPSTTEASIHKQANYLFRGKQADERIPIEHIEYNKEEFIEFKRGVYKQGVVKGDLIHALLQFQIALMNGQNIIADKLKSKIAQLEQLSSVQEGAYNWVIESANFKAIMHNVGINISKDIAPERRDKVHSEVSVANNILGVAGKIDTIVERPNGTMKIVDYKTGNRFNNKLGATIMNYGSQEFDIVDSGLGKAKLQVMLYSVVIKASHPDAKFEPPVVMHIPNQSKAKSRHNIHQVEVRDYLKMIEQYYKNEQPEVYKQLIAQSPKIFNPSEYGASINTSFTQDLLDDKTGMRDDEMLRKYEVELEQLNTSIALRGREEDNYKAEPTAAEKTKRDKLTMKILQARTTLGLPLGVTKDHEISKFTMWLGTINDTHNPYIQAYSQVVGQARAKVYEEYTQVESEFNSKLSKVIGQKSGLERAFKPVDALKIFEKLIHEEVEEDPTDGQRRVRRGMITEKDPGWSALSAEEKNLVVFMRDKMKEVFDQVLVNGPNAIISSENGKDRTKLDIYNKSLGADFKWTPSFIPKVRITASEVRWQATKNGWSGAKNYMKHAIANRMSMFYEENIEGENQLQYGIPVKYIGSKSDIHNPDLNTSNLEVAFKTYMQHMINKKHYDTVYALGDSIKGYLAMQKTNENASEFVGYHMHRNLIGRIDDQGQGYWRKGFKLPLTIDDKPIYFSPVKFQKLIGSGVAAAALWLNVPSSAKNAAQAMWAVSKESMVNSLASTEWGGVSVDNQDLSGKNHAKAYALWGDYQKACMMGNGKAHPVHVFMKSFRMYPEMTELGTRKDLLTQGATALSTNNLSILYGYPEAMTTAVLGMDAMMTMTVKSGPYAGKSMWDIYSNSIKVDDSSGEGTFELPTDFTRGKLRMGDNTLQELKGLNPLEIQKLHRIVQRVKGGYRTEERSMVEAHAIGELFMLFRRYLPAAIVNGLKAKQYDHSIGSLVKTDQEDVYEWQARLTEGRLRTAAGGLYALFGLRGGQGYKWADMSDMQKRNILDLGMTFTTWALTGALVAVAFGDSDDEDSAKKWASEMNMRLIEQWNFIDWAKTATDQPVAVKRSLEAIAGMWELSAATAHLTTGNEEDAYTARDDLKGLNQVMKNIPVVGGFYYDKKFIDNSDYWSE